MAALAWAVGAAPAHANGGPPDRIAFSSNRTGTAQIWVMDADGSGQTRLTESGPLYQDTQPAWSPDGRRIAFSRAPVGYYESVNLAQSEIWVMDADGSDPQALVSEPGMLADRPQWSPDGTRIAYMRGAATQVPFDIWVVNADGTDRRAITTTGDANYPAWSPDGRRIAFARAAQVWAMNPDGTEQVQLTSAGRNFVPNWAPGRRIVFTSDRDGGGKRTYTMEPDGSDQRAVPVSAPGAEHKLPAWSPDGRRIALAIGDRPCSGQVDAVLCQVDNGYELYSVGADGRDLLQLTRTAVPERQFGESYPAYAPRRAAATPPVEPSAGDRRAPAPRAAPAAVQPAAEAGPAPAEGDVLPATGLTSPAAASVGAAAAGLVLRRLTPLYRRAGRC